MTVYALAQKNEPTVLLADRTVAMQEFQRREGWTTEMLKGDHAVRRFIEGEVSYIRNGAGTLRIDAVEQLKETK